MKMSLEEYVSTYSGYPKAVADYYYGQVHDFMIDCNDLIQEGFLAMINGYANYDENKASLSTYAYMTVKYGVMNYISKKRTIVYISPDLILASSKLERIRINYYMKNGCKMPMEQMVEFVRDTFSYLNYRLDEKFVELLLKISKYYVSSKTCSIDSNTYNDEASFRVSDSNGTIGDIISLDYCLEDEVIKKLCAEQILNFVKNNFSEVDANIFLEYFGFVDGVPKTFKELGIKYGVTPQGINRRQSRTMKKVKQKFNN